PGDTLKADCANARPLLRRPPLTVSHHHGWLTDPLAGATAARERAVPLSRSRRDRSGPRPSLASRAATAWPSLCHGCVPAAAQADVSWREVDRNYSTRDTRLTAAATRLHPCTACSPGARPRPHAAGG